MFGFLSAPPSLEGVKFLDRASEEMRHRGPDDWGAVFWNNSFVNIDSAWTLDQASCGLGHRRLSIIDPSSAGRQPMTSFSGHLTLSYNGELYNFRRLREEIGLSRVHWQSDSDTEVLVEILDQFGIEGLNRAVGMFALAFIDRRNRSLVLARDEFGIKPMYYRQVGQSVYFSSEISPLLRIYPEVTTGDVKALSRFVAAGITDDSRRTMFHGVQQVEPGTWVKFTVKNGALVVESSSWVVRRRSSGITNSSVNASDLLESITESTKLHLVSDVPVSMSLSGGVDSPLLLGALRRFYEGPIDCFSYSAGEGADDDERSRAQFFASKYGAHLHLVEIEDRHLVDDLNNLVRIQEQPVSSTSALAQKKIFQAANSHGYKVMIDGQGADELFGGYEFFRLVLLAQCLREGRLRNAMPLFRGMNDKLPARLVLNSIFLALSRNAQRALVCRRDRRIYRNFIGQDLVAPLENYSGTEVNDYPRDVHEALRISAQKTSLPMLLRYADRNAMSSSVENRTPFLTESLLALSESLSINEIISPFGETKTQLRSAARLVHQIEPAWNGRKIGFGTSQEQWTQRFPTFRQWLGDVVGGTPVGLLSEDCLRALNEVVRCERTLSPLLWRAASISAWAQLFAISDWFLE